MSQNLEKGKQILKKEISLLGNQILIQIFLVQNLLIYPSVTMNSIPLEAKWNWEY